LSHNLSLDQNGSNVVLTVARLFFLCISPHE
jgi:hypothetical protein